MVLTQVVLVKPASAEVQNKPLEKQSPLCKGLYDLLFCKSKKIQTVDDTMPPEDGFLSLLEPAKPIEDKKKPAKEPSGVLKRPIQAAYAAVQQPAPQTIANPLNADVIFNLVNQLREQAGLPAFEKEPKLCELAQARGPELYGEIFVTRSMHSGLYNRNLPYWVVENIIYSNSEQQAVNWWLGSPIHRASIYKNYKYSCTACVGNSCSELFTNYEPKNPLAS